MALQERPPVEPSEPGQMDDRLSEFVGKYAVRAVAGIILVLIVVGLSLYFTDRSAAESARAWSRFARVAQGEDYKDDDAQAGAFATIADDFPGHPAGFEIPFLGGSSPLAAGEGSDAACLRAPGPVVPSPA